MVMIVDLREMALRLDDICGRKMGKDFSWKFKTTFEFFIRKKCHVNDEFVVFEVKHFDLLLRDTVDSGSS